MDGTAKVGKSIENKFKTSATDEIEVFPPVEELAALTPISMGKNASQLAADGDGLQLKMAATQQRGHSDELAGRQVLGGEVSSIDAVEFVEKR